MALLKPILQCLVDQEPTAFHNSDADGETFSFAVNLSLDCRGDGTTSEDIKAEESAAEQQNLNFLSAAPNVKFYLFSVTEPGWQLEYAGTVHSTSDTSAPQNPHLLWNWLKEQKPKSGANRYWTTASSHADLVIDADDAIATHRLRAAQAWNAPVAHRFGLTHVVRVARDRIADGRFIILPYFDSLTDTPDVPVFEFKHDGTVEEPLNGIALDYDYDPLGGLWKVTGRTNLIGEEITTAFSLSDIVPRLTQEGYFEVDSDAENVRRLLDWLEERAASLMTANSGLLPQGNSKDEIEAFEKLFKIQIKKVEQENKRTEFYWDGMTAPWYAATRLVSALDNLVIALLKPVPASSDAAASEGEVLAPLVSALIARIKREVAEPNLIADPTLVDGRHLTAAIRKVLIADSPLMSRKGGTPAEQDALFVNALRHVYALSAMSKIFDERTLLSALLGDFRTPGQKIDDSSIGYLDSLVGKSAQAISRALVELEQALHDEAGAEAAIIRVIETVETTVDASSPPPDRKLSALLAAAITNDTSLRAQVQRAVDAAWADYRALLDGPFNGAEAIRRAASSTFVRELLSYAELHPSTKKKKPRTTSEYLGLLLHVSSFYETRFFKKPRELLGLTEALLKPDITRLPASAHFAMRLQLRKAFYAAIEPLKYLNDPNARFIPDSTPQPVTIQIAANIDGSKLDKFAKHFNGIGVAIRRADSATPGPWAHANLADLGWQPLPAVKFPDDPPPDIKGAIHPMLPAASDGRSPMFIEYQGFPFSDRAHDARILDGDAEPRDDRRPFYRHDPHVDNDFPKVPRLAYGRAFKTFSFVTSNAGTLPLSLQLDPASPWLPNSAPPSPGTDDPLAPPPLLVGTALYQRRTAIAQMAVRETPVAGQAPRIGAEIAGVTPIARDYPRVGLLAQPNEPAVRDILREADGTGKMATTQNSEWRLSDIKFDGVPKTLTLRFFDRPAQHPTDSGDATFKIDKDKISSFTEIVLRIEFKKKERTFERWLHVSCGETTLPPKKLRDGNRVAGWVRLVLDAEASGPATMTFANVDSQTSDNVKDPLLLLAPKGDVWTDGLSRPVEVTVSTPRVGYLDFERWFANADSRKGMFYLPEEEEDEDVENSVRQFELALIAAYVMRHLDPGLSSCLDRLPDPAVEQVRIELTPHDALTAQKPEIDIAHQTLALKEKLRDFGRDFSSLVARMIAKENLPQPGEHIDRPWTPLRLRRYLFDPLDKLFEFKIELGPDASLSLKKVANVPPRFSATVPAGAVARLSIDALVSNEYFKEGGHPSVFHSGLKQYAQRELQGKYLTFPAAALRIETMYDGMFQLAAKDPEKEDRNQPAICLAAAMIGVEGIDRTRRFDLVTSAQPSGADAIRHWRLLGEIDVTTQRWRNSGRPIYHHVNPRQYRFDEGSENAAISHLALRLKFGPDGRDELAQFELEAFFDRSDVDAQTITKTLEPLPARTRLQEHYWNPESATYFRHRFKLRSRYVGALKKRSDGEAIAWPTRERTKKLNVELKTPAHAWTMRVAMLADLARIQLTRPQLRALIPLTTAPGGEGTDRPAPPVAAILQEPPFARGGLADRIATEIKTGFGYGFEPDAKPDKKNHVEILDARKEAGPNPQLDYRALGKDTALSLTLRSEGPIGLTFDNAEAPAPAFPNSMLILKPDVLFGDKPALEEFFAGVTMRRYIDPAWTGAEGIDKGEIDDKSGFDAESCWWIDFGARKTDRELPLLQYKVDGSSDLEPLLKFKPRGTQHIELRASKLAIDGYGGANTDWVVVAVVTTEQFGKLSVLHQEVAAARYSMSVFVRTGSAKTERGEINSPLLIAGFEWSSPKEKAVAGGGKTDKPPSVRLEVASARVFQTMASGPTFLRWTKTGRDFDFVHLAELANNEWKTGPVHVRELAARLDHDTHEFLTFQRTGSPPDSKVWLCSSTFANPFPIHVHRHLGVITSRFLKELGTPAEIFCRTSAWSGRWSSTEKVDAAAKYQLVTPEGSLRLEDGKIFKPQEEVVRIVEFETPAAILCANAPLVPQTYKQAYFDLVSTGFKFEAERGTAQLHFRFVGSPAHIAKFTEIQLSFWLSEDQVSKSKTGLFPLLVKFANTATRFAVGLRLALKQDGATDKGYHLQVLYSDRTLTESTGKFEKDPEKKDPFPLLAATRINPGFFLSIDGAKGSSGEFWSDVSLLHSPRALAKGISPLEFDWLFSPSGDGDPITHVAAAGLTNMIEAQARIVAVSPPIPIVSH